MAIEWLATFKATRPQGATTSNKLVQYKLNRKTVESSKMEQSYKFKEYPLVEKVALEIDVK